MSSKQSMFEATIALFGLGLVFHSIGEAVSDVAFLGWIAPLFNTTGVILFLAAVVYPVYDTWKLLTAPPPPIEWE